MIGEIGEPEDRLRCAVPFCTRTRKRETEPWYQEWICGMHWLALPEPIRRAYNRAKRKHQTGKLSQEGIDRLWFRAKRMAIERAAGVQ